MAHYLKYKSDNFDSNYNHILKKLEAEKIIGTLWSEKVISYDEYDKIVQMDEDGKNQYLLEIIRHDMVNKLQPFIDALQEHEPSLAACITGDKEPMLRQNKDVLSKYTMELLENMICDRVLLILVGEKALTNRDKDVIKSHQSLYEQNNKLLDLLQKRPNSAYYKFIDALINSEQEHLACLLENPGSRDIQRENKLMITKIRKLEFETAGLKKDLSEQKRENSEMHNKVEEIEKINVELNNQLEEQTKVKKAGKDKLLQLPEKVERNSDEDRMRHQILMSEIGQLKLELGLTKHPKQARDMHAAVRDSQSFNSQFLKKAPLELDLHEPLRTLEISKRFLMVDDSHILVSTKDGTVWKLAVESNSLEKLCTVENNISGFIMLDEDILVLQDRGQIKKVNLKNPSKQKDYLVDVVGVLSDGIAVNNYTIILVDTGGKPKENGEVYQYKLPKGPQKTLVTKLFYPTSINRVVMTGKGSLYAICEKYSHRVSVFNEFWQKITLIGGNPGDATGCLHHPMSAMILSNPPHDIIVCDYKNNRVTAFSRNGCFCCHILEKEDKIKRPIRIAFNEPYLWVLYEISDKAYNIKKYQVIE